MTNKRACVYIHRLYFDGKIKKGGLDQIIDYLLAIDYQIYMFEFPLDYTQNRNVIISSLTKNGQETLVQFNMPKVLAQINWTFEVCASVFLSLKYVKSTKLVLTSDPLSTVPAVILRSFGFYRFIYFHNVDFSTDRFKNKFLNTVYFLLLKLGLRNADLVGVVTRQAKFRLKQYRSGEIYFVPNSPDFNSLEPFRQRLDQKDIHSLVVTCSHVSHKYMVHELVKLTSRLKKTFPAVKLNVVGYFDTKDEFCIKLKELVSKLQLNNNVIFYGNVDRDTNYKIIAVSGVGLAFYDGQFSHVIYGDALKIREYCALGLPVIADSHTHTAVEMGEKGAGFVTDTFDEAFTKIKQLFNNVLLYEKCAYNSLQWARENDKRTIMNNISQKFEKYV